MKGGEGGLKQGVEWWDRGSEGEEERLKQGVEWWDRGSEGEEGGLKQGVALLIGLATDFFEPVINLAIMLLT